MQSEVDKAFSQSRKVSQRQGAWTGNLSTLTKDRVNLRLRSPKPLHGSLQTVHTLSPFIDRVSASLVRTQNQRFCNHALRFGSNSKVRTGKTLKSGEPRSQNNGTKWVRFWNQFQKHRRTVLFLISETNNELNPLCKTKVCTVWRTPWFPPRGDPPTEVSKPYKLSPFTKRVSAR